MNVCLVLAMHARSECKVLLLSHSCKPILPQLLWCKSTITILSQRLARTVKILRFVTKIHLVSMCRIFLDVVCVSFHPNTKKYISVFAAENKINKTVIWYASTILPLVPLLYYSFSPQVRCMGSAVCDTRTFTWEKEKGGAGNMLNKDMKKKQRRGWMDETGVLWKAPEGWLWKQPC